MKRTTPRNPLYAVLLAGSLLALAGPASAIVIDGTTMVGDTFELDFILQVGETDNGGNTNNDPDAVDLTATIIYTVTRINYASTLDLLMEISNTTVGFDERIAAVGFDSESEIDILNFTGGTTFDDYDEDTTFPSFQNIEFCTHPNSNNCGSSFPNALRPGETDTVGITLSWGGGPLIITPTTIKFVGDLGSFQFSEHDDKDCCVSVPEPGTLSLLGAGLVGVGLIVRRRRWLGRKQIDA